MRWTSVALAACVVPALTGCGALRRGSTDEGGLRLARRDAAVEYRRDAEGAWERLRTRHSGRGFSADFRDGFLDGYADFCDRGVGCEAPPVPPVPYARYKRFFGRGGNDLVRDYYAGFQHGADTAAAGSRPVPAPAPSDPPRALPPRPADMPPPKQPDFNKFGEPKKKGSDDPPLLPPPAGGASTSPLPKSELPVIKPFGPDPSAGGKFAPVPADVERVPPPFPPLPVDVPLAVPSDAPKLSVPPVGPVPIPVPAYKVPAHERSPLDPVPPLPLRHVPK